MMPLWQDLYEGDESDEGGTWDECPQCGSIFGGDEYISQRCFACGWTNLPDSDDDWLQFGEPDDPFEDQ